MSLFQRWRPFAVIPGLVALTALAACTGGDDSRAEAACREKGYTRGTVAFAECVHPEDAEKLERAQEVWERDAEGRR